MRNCSICGAEIGEDSFFCEVCAGEFKTKKFPRDIFLPLPCGTVLMEKYKIEEQIASDGVKNLYSVRDITSDVIYLLIEISWGASDDEKKVIYNKLMLDRNQLTGAYKIGIPHIVDIFDIDEHLYVAEEFVEGKNLVALLQEEYPAKIALERVLKWAIQLTRTLEYLHGFTPPLIYRELTPYNIIIRNSDKRAVLFDFSVASFAGEKTSVMSSEVPSGFMPPEYYTGIISPQIDIFSLGANIYYLLTGAGPEIIHYKPLKNIIPYLPEELDSIIHLAMSLNPDERFSSAWEMRKALEDFIKNYQYKTGKIVDIDILLKDFKKVNNSKEKINIIKFMSGYSEPKIVASLIQILEDDRDPLCRRVAAKALGKVKSNSVIELLIKKTGDNDVRVVLACLAGLGNFKDKRAVKCLVEFLKNRDMNIRKTAAGALEKIGDPSALESLVEARNREGFLNIFVKSYMDRAIKSLMKKKLENDDISVSGNEFPVVVLPCEKDGKFRYEEKDKIYIHLIYKLFDEKHKNPVFLIFQNKNRMDKRFFEVLDHEYNLLSEISPVIADRLSALMNFKDTVFEGNRFSPPYEPSQEELQNLADYTFEEIRMNKVQKFMSLKELAEIEEVFEKEKIEKEEPSGKTDGLLPEKEKKSLWKKARKEFPDSRMAQEYYYLKLVEMYLAGEGEK